MVYTEGLPSIAGRISGSRLLSVRAALVPMSRHLLGILAVLLFAAGLLLLLSPSNTDWQQAMLGSTVRIGLVLFAVWLAYPQLSRVPTWMFRAVLAASLIVAWRPKLALLAIPLLVVIWILRPRGKAVKSAAKPRRASQADKQPPSGARTKQG